MKNRLSIIIPSFNTAAATLKCVQSINKFLPQAETIVVDNASTDNTVELLKKLKVKLIPNSRNIGFSAACNLGAQKAVGDYLLFLNSDMELVDKSFLKMLKFLQNHPKVGAIGPKFLYPDHSPQASVFPPQTIKNAFKQFWLNQKCFSKYTPKNKNPTPVWAISGGALLIKKSLFQKISGWNEKYFIYFEDLDLCRSLRRLGKKIYYYPATQVIHRHGLSGKKLAVPQNQWRRLIPSSQKYHGWLKHTFLNLIIKFGQKFQKLTPFFSFVTK